MKQPTPQRDTEQKEKIITSDGFITTEALSLQEQQQLFQKDVFIQALKKQPEKMAVIIKRTLNHADQQMHRWFNEGRNIAALVHGRAWLLDQLICGLWKQCLQTVSNVSLFATGGYGRGELHPYSDIDLLVLSEYPLSPKASDAIERFVTLLWDTGLKIGTSVRSLFDCSTLAAKDITVLTSLMEARLLSGSQVLEEKLAQCIAPSIMWSGDHYLQAKYAEQKQRYDKYNQTSYNLEPHLKESPGGLRDIHLVLWVTQRHYGSANLNRLVEIGFLLPEESLLLQNARNVLWRIRWALHMICKRSEERLLFEYQKTLASQLGYKDTNDSLALEQFMQTYFRAVTDIATMKDLLIQHFHDDILSKNIADEVTPINARFQLRNHYIEVTHPDVFKAYPPAIFELFVLMTNHSSILGARASTIRALRSNLNKIDPAFRENKEVTHLFMKLLRAPYGLSAALRKMVRYGILGRYLPEFAHITGKMQFDLFHVYTVEAHTLLLIKFLRRFRYTSNKSDFPLAYAANATLRARELLYIAALYHDIAKGRGGNHSELGATDAQTFCKNHGLDKADTELVVWLVRHHLRFSITAQRQDLSDPEVIHKFAGFVGSIERLNYLYCLTVADINATNPKLWNNWRATLLDTLYTESHRILLDGCKATAPNKKQQFIHRKQQALTYLREKHIDANHVTSFWAKISQNYFLRYSAAEIAWHTEHLLEHSNTHEPLVIAKTVKGLHKGGTAIFIYAPHTPERFAFITLILERLNFNIMDAKVMVSHQHCMDTFIVLEADNTTIPEHSRRIDEACYTLKQSLMHPSTIKRIHHRRTPRLLRYFSQLPKIRFSNDTANQRTIVEVFATDRPGLLAVIVDTFSAYDIYVQNAKILTLGERVEDVFFISTSEGKPLSDPLKQKQLSDALTKRLVAHIEKDCYPT